MVFKSWKCPLKVNGRLIEQTRKRKKKWKHDKQNKFSGNMLNIKFLSFIIFTVWERELVNNVWMLTFECHHSIQYQEGIFYFTFSEQCWNPTFSAFIIKTLFSKIDQQARSKIINRIASSSPTFRNLSRAIWFQIMCFSVTHRPLFIHFQLPV